MRLDHLLSKELPRNRGARDAARVWWLECVLVGGTSIVGCCGRCAVVSTAPFFVHALCACGVRGVGKAWCVWCGGRVVRCWVSEGSAVAGLLWCVASLVCCSRVMRGWRVGVGWCVENCIVDASIFVVSSF